MPVCKKQTNKQKKPMLTYAWIDIMHFLQQQLSFNPQELESKLHSRNNITIAGPHVSMMFS